MRYGTFLGIVEEVSGLLHRDAERTVHAVVWVLGWRISTGEAEDIAAFLPAELRLTLTDAPDPAQAFGLDEFVRRVAKLEGVDETTAFQHARAVFVALGQAAALGELRDPVSQLPKDYEPLLRAAVAGRRAAEGRDGVIGRVAMITGLDPAQARRATEAALEKLAVRVSRGEIHDHIAEVPAELHPANEHVSRAEVECHARAVFAALRDVISSNAAQLSRDCEPLAAASTSPSAATAASGRSWTGSGSSARSVGR